MIPFVRQMAFEYGRVDRVSPRIRRLIANNPGPFTFRGTGTYIVGDGEVAVIDPGPMLDEHWTGFLPGHVLTGFPSTAFGGLVDSGVAGAGLLSIVD